MAFGDHLSRMDAAIINHLRDGDGTYIAGASTLTDVPYLLDRDYQTYDENQLPQIITTISIPSSTIERSRSSDRFIANGKEWKVHQTLEDDGHWRRLYVS
jgi:hypothetical protein